MPGKQIIQYQKNNMASAKASIKYYEDLLVEQRDMFVKTTLIFLTQTLPGIAIYYYKESYRKVLDAIANHFGDTWLRHPMRGLRYRYEELSDLLNKTRAFDSAFGKFQEDLFAQFKKWVKEYQYLIAVDHQEPLQQLVRHLKKPTSHDFMKEILIYVDKHIDRHPLEFRRIDIEIQAIKHLFVQSVGSYLQWLSSLEANEDQLTLQSSIVEELQVLVNEADTDQIFAFHHLFDLFASGIDTINNVLKSFPQAHLTGDNYDTSKVQFENNYAYYVSVFRNILPAMFMIFLFIPLSAYQEKGYGKQCIVKKYTCSSFIESQQLVGQLKLKYDRLEIYNRKNEFLQMSMMFLTLLLLVLASDIETIFMQPLSVVLLAFFFYGSAGFNDSMHGIKE